MEDRIVISLGIKAKNSSGLQHLLFEIEANGCCLISLTGEYKGKPIQIDFDALSLDELDDLVSIVSARTAKARQVNKALGQV